MTAENKNNIDKLISDIETGKRKLFYCSFAELAETAFMTNVTATRAMEAARGGDYDEGIEGMFFAFASHNPLSTELVADLFFILVAANEFYYVAKLVELCHKYFINGDFSDVPIKDRPYINIANEMWTLRYWALKIAFNDAMTFNFNGLIKFITDFACNCESIERNGKKKNKSVDDIRNDIQRYLNS